MALTNEELLAKLESHPKLLARVKQLIEIVDNDDELKDIRWGDDAEEAVRSNLQPFGQELLEEWGKTQATKAGKNFKNRLDDAKLHSKKN
jgi:hypothetical protein